MDNKYKLSEYYERIGEEVKAERFPELDGCMIAWVEADVEKQKNGKRTYATCFKVKDEYKWTCDYDFFIVVYEPNAQFFSDEQIRILLRHELMHVGYDRVLQDCWTIAHDIEDFRQIIIEEGLDWALMDFESKLP